MLYPAARSLNICDSCSICFSNYCNFKGRGRRSEFWWFFLVCGIIIGIFQTILSNFLIYICDNDNDYFFNCKIEIKNNTTFYICLIAFLLVEIILSIPLLAASTRRLHDVGYSGWYNFLILIPIINFFLCYLWVLDSDMLPNNYGASPKYNNRQDLSLINNNINPINQPITLNTPSNYQQPGNQPHDYVNSEVQTNSETLQQPLADQEQIPVNEMPPQPPSEENQTNDQKEQENNEVQENNEEQEKENKDELPDNEIVQGEGENIEESDD